jgi:hypothetical protein
MKRYAVITKVEIFAGEDKIGEVFDSDCIGYKAKLNDTFISSSDIAFVGKVLDYVVENGDLNIEEEI